PKNQLILALPYYGSLWDSPYSIIPSGNSTFVEHITYADIRKKYINKPVYDTISYTAYYIEPNPASQGYKQTWFDDEKTLAKKYDFILEQDLYGVGIWALGYDNGHTALWKLLDTKFGAHQATSKKDSTETQTPADTTQTSTVNITKDSLQQLQQKWQDSILAAVGSLVGKSPTGVITLPGNDSIAFKLKKQIFGWHPYWNKDKEKYTRYRYDLLSSISYFSYELNPADGSCKNMHDWATTPVVDLAKQNNCKVYLTVTNQGEDSNNSFLSNFTAQKNSIPAIVNAVKLRNANGVTLNFEVVPGSLSHNLSLYVIGLSNALKAEGLELNMTIPAKDTRNAFAVEDLLKHVDQFIIMGYNYYTRGSTVAGP
ncbi:MAG: hypothetical protein KDD04_10755, partial [Sinomicrobium sp.]|nr:hypothetical protein [Sinomicrobium sp.]